MSSSSATTSLGETQRRSSQPLVPTSAWGWIVPLAVLFVLLHAKYFERLLRIVTETRGGGWDEILSRLAMLKLNADWAHVLVIPFFSIYYLFLYKRELLTTPRRVSLPGLVMMMLAICSFVFWVYPGRNDMFQGFSMVACLFGIAWFLLGPSMMKILWFPIGYLVFTVKISDMIWDRLAWKLQLIAAQSSEIVLNTIGFFFGLDAQVRGSTIDLAVHGVPLDPPLNVAEACSGLRMLMAFIALGVAIAFMARRPLWQRLIMLGATIPIAVLVNVGRVTTLGFLYALVDKNLAAGDVHLFIGMLMLIPAAGLCWLLGWILDRVVIPDETDESVGAANAMDGRPAGSLQTDGVRAWMRPQPGTVLAGLAGGVMLAGLAGLIYSLAWGIYQPERIFGAWFQPSWAIPALALAGGMLIGAFVLIGRLSRDERAARGRDGDGGGANSGHTPWFAISVVAGVLASSALGLGTMVEAAEVVLIKEPIPLRMKLNQLPQKTGDWEMIREHPPLSADIAKTLGTDQYISRDYVDKSWPASKAGAALTLHIAYYTGTPDTVPHVPDRCFVAGGIPPRGTIGGHLLLEGPAYREVGDGLWQADSELADRHGQPDPHLPQIDPAITVFTFGDPANPNRSSNVIYFFAANGRFMASPNDVRKHGLSPRDRYGYHCKVEVQLPGVADPQEAVGRANAFLSQMLPEIMSCLPDWELLQQADGSEDVSQGD